MCPRGSIGYANKTNEPFILLPNLLVVAEGNNDAIQPYFDFSVISTELYESIEDGDIGIINNGNMIRVILSRRANHNTVLVTERCNNLCLFCSQPPKKSNDDWLLTQSALAIASFGLDGVVGVSGGEPLLYGDDFLHFIDFIIENSPDTALHVLTNGRKFADINFTQEMAKRSKRSKSPLVSRSTHQDHLCMIIW